MKKEILLLLIILLSWQTQAQDLLSRTQIFHAVEWQHPGLAGVQENLSVDLMYRQALNGYGSNSGYYQVGGFYPIKNSVSGQDDNSGFKISNPDKAKELYNSKTARRKQGVGLQLNAIILGPLDRKEIKGFYAYHLPVSDKLNLSLGTSLKFQQNMIGFNNLTVRDEINDDFYQKIVNSAEGKQTNLQLDIGTALYSEQFFFTFTAKSLFITELNNNNALEYLKDGGELFWLCVNASAMIKTKAANIWALISPGFNTPSTTNFPNQALKPIKNNAKNEKKTFIALYFDDLKEKKIIKTTEKPSRTETKRFTYSIIV